MDMSVLATVRLTLTRREFNLVSKALTGALHPGPKVDRDGAVIGNDVEEALDLGVRLIRERIHQARDYADRLEIAALAPLEIAAERAQEAD